MNAQDRRDDISANIFSVSATLIGVCLTVIGVLRVVSRLSAVSTVAEELLSIDALAFLTSCTMAYIALRTDDLALRHRRERRADVVFLLALSVMALASGLLALELM